MQQKTLTVPDISCGHCKMAIEGAVKKLAGIESVSADVPGKKVSLEFDESRVSLNDIIRSIEEAGYTVHS